MKNFRIWALAVLMLSFMVSLSAASDYAQYYTNLPFEMEQVQAVVIPDYTVVLTDFGGVGDGETMCTEAFANAIKHLRKQGGGHLIVPEGIWLTGPIQLRSNIDLHLNAGAVVRFSPNRELYVQPSDTLRDGSKKCYALLRGQLQQGFLKEHLHGFGIEVALAFKFLHKGLAQRVHTLKYVCAAAKHSQCFVGGYAIHPSG